ncbi:YbaB/EbfC family nucleoid-associated protein [Actinophytocola sp. NPDC049390]|uniref:YbaB/EbfC family nucleoid-associated protein n=1 Tax=Actinophytocola sp. NPDC049390 TaxID=3363894 RepID=UPI00379D367A
MSSFEVPDSAELMAELRRHQDAIEQIQRSVDALVVKGHSRANEVVATVRGTGRFTEIAIDAELPRRYDAHDLGAIVTEAVNDALGKLAAATNDRFAPVLGNTQQG